MAFAAGAAALALLATALVVSITEHAAAEASTELAAMGAWKGGEGVGSASGGTRSSSERIASSWVTERASRSLARTLKYTRVVLYNQRNFLTSPAGLKPGLVTFPITGATCRAIPTKFQKSVQSARFYFMAVSRRGGNLRSCSKITFYVQPGCKGFSLAYARPKKAPYAVVTPSFPSIYASQVVSLSCM